MIQIGEEAAACKEVAKNTWQNKFWRMEIFKQFWVCFGRLKNIYISIVEIIATYPLRLSLVILPLVLSGLFKDLKARNILQIAYANNTILTDYTPVVSPPLAIMWLHHNIPKWVLNCFNKVSRDALWHCAQELVGFINGWSELNLEFPLTPVTMARNLVPQFKAKIRLFFAERSNGTFNNDALSSVWIKERLRAILCRQIRGLQNGYVCELDWPLWDLARHHQDPDPAQILDLDEDLLTEVEAQDPQEAGNLDNLFVTLAQLEEKVAFVTVAATIIKRSKELTTTTTASEVERQLQEKFHTIIRCGGLITDEPL